MRSHLALAIAFISVLSVPCHAARDRDVWIDQQCVELSKKISIQEAYGARRQGIDRETAHLSIMLAGTNGMMNAEYIEVATRMVDVIYDAKPNESLSEVALRARRHCVTYLRRKLSSGNK